MPTMPEIKCAGTVSSVVVYAEGALVTRKVDVSAIPGDAAEIILVIPGVSPIAASPRVQLKGAPGRIVRSASVIFCPKAKDAPKTDLRNDGTADGSENDPLEEKLCRRDIAAALARSQRDRGNCLASALPKISLSGRNPRAQPLDRVRDLLALSDRLGNAVAVSDARLRGLIEEEVNLGKEIEALELKKAQASSAGDDRGEDKAEIRISLGGSGSIESLEVTYSVSAARWWPAYSVRFTEGGTEAGISLEAYLIQDCGEDWSGVKLSLCTASMLAEADMPTLASLRIGRAQPPRASGFRKPPEALDEMFASWDASGAAAAGRCRMEDAPPESLPQPINIFKELTDDDDEDDEDFTDSDADRDFEKLLGIVDRWKKESADAVKPNIVGGGFSPAAMSAANMMFSAPMPSPMRPAEREKEIGGASRVRRRSAEKKASANPMGMMGAMMGRAVSAIMPGAAKCSAECCAAPPQDDAMMEDAEVMCECEACEPDFRVSGGGSFRESTDASSWLEFDELRLADSLKESAQRGKLIRSREKGPVDNLRLMALNKIRTASAHRFAQTPSTGGFDHIIHALGTPDIPSDGIVHRIPLASGSAESVQSLVTAPVREEGVYREAVLKNPFSMPLLSGPADIFFGGVLLTTDKIETIGRGGTIRMGLGLEERVRVVRNARTKESVRGVLGGDTEVRTEVEIEVQSLLGKPTEFILLDRYPIAESSDVKIELAPLEAGCTRYDQKDRYKRIGGGLRWNVKLGPGERRVFHFAYTMTFSSKFEVEGGNRRD